MSQKQTNTTTTATNNMQPKTSDGGGGGQLSKQQEGRMSHTLNKSLSDADKLMAGRRKIHLGSQAMNSQLLFKSNFIKTSKYTAWNFLPLCIALQFKRYANIYFLVIAILQTIPAISPLNPFSAWAPLIIVIGLSMAREGYEDYQRYKSDVEMNSSTTRVYRDSKFIECKWGDVLVGDLVKIVENETFPADIIVLNASNEGGVCFIETSSLDGEKNYKNKEAMSQTIKWVELDKPDRVIRLVGSVNCIQPNENLHQFEGTILYNGDQVIVGAKQFLLRGAKLKNTKWIAGIVVYTGEDTKIMMNADKSKYKVSNIEAETNKFIISIFIFQLLISICSAIGNSIWNSSQNPEYRFIPDPSYVHFEGFLTFLTYLVLNNTMIPISLIVSLEVVKLVQGFIIAADEELIQKEDGKIKVPRVYTTSINEELGQVQYIFSDKTGTLTCNKMELKLCCIGNHLYGDQKILQDLSSPQKRKRSLRKPTLVDENSEIVFYKKDDTLVQVINGNGNFSVEPFQMQDCKTQQKVLYTLNSQKDIVNDYFMLLATCHECVIEQKDQSELDEAADKLLTENKSIAKKQPASNNSQNANTSLPVPKSNNNNNTLKIEMGQLNNIDPSPVPSSQNTAILPIKHSEIKYQGPSPDETTLVDTARHYGYVFLGSTSAYMNLEVQGEKTQVELLKLFEFNSDRKRMSVIIRQNGLIKMYIKGADNKIKERLNAQVEQPYLTDIQARIDEFSKKGLRTLLLAMKVMEESEYAELEKKYQAAGNAANREEMFFKIAEEYEKDLYLIGATAVEDKLQDRVPETIRDLLQAKINIWMLTGDKMETAENIAKSCKLIQPHFRVLRYTVPKPPFKEGQVYKTPPNLIHDELNRLFYEKEQLMKLKREKALLIEGEDLVDVFSTEEFQDMLVATVKHCESVVCCRATPKQKAQVVKLVKDKLNKITLAIGDGANDVNMIQEAHIGVGLFGQEGMRAVQSSDYALPEFKGLWRLLLVHGRWNYIRISEMILYFFYKNFVFTIPQFFFSFSNGFSGQSIFDDYYITLYNIIFTAFPLIIRAVTEQDLYYKVRERDQENQERLINHSKLLKLFPKAYYVGQQSLIFNKKNFIIWLIQALIHSSIIYAVHLLSISKEPMTSDGYSPDLWVVSISIYSTIILVVDVKIALNTKYWTKLMVMALLLTSIAPYFLYIFIANLFEQFNVYMTAQAVFSMPNFYLNIFFCVFLVVSFDVIILYLHEVDYRGFVQHLRSLLKNKQDLDNSEYIERLNHVDINQNQGRNIPDALPVEKKYSEYAN